MIRLETHAHTCEVSPCGHMPAEELVGLTAQHGYDALVVTDHLNEEFKADLPLAERAEAYLEGYRKAKQAGETYGIKILLGAELRLRKCGDEDFLTYGLKEEDIPKIITALEACASIKELHEFTQSMGYLFYQAHPYREGLRVQDASWLDGIEVFNAHPRHDSHNDRAMAYALEHGLRMLSGSDAHQVQDVARGGILVPESVTDNGSLVAYLRENPCPERITC